MTILTKVPIPKLDFKFGDVGSRRVHRVAYYYTSKGIRTQITLTACTDAEYQEHCAELGLGQDL